MLSLQVAKRETRLTPSALKKEGLIAGVVYGPKHASTPISFSAGVFEKVFRKAGESSVIELTGIGSEAVPVLIHEVDHDPVTYAFRHIDFYAIEKGAKVEVAIPLVFTGESPAMKEGANLVKVLHELEIEADPMSLPHDLTVDISVLTKIGDQIRAGDIKLPAGVVLKIKPEEVIVLVQEVKEEVVERAPVDLSAIEVEKKGKEEEAGEAGAAAPAAEAKK